MDDWLALTPDPLPVADVTSWAVTRRCGAVVTFVGTVRDHSEGRSGVTTLDYEAYAEQVEPRLAEVAAAARARWPVIGRIALVHRVGALSVEEAAVVVTVSTPSRDEAFAAARFCIDTVKATVPIWKRETWDGGTDWGTCAHDLTDVDPHPDGVRASS
ncbi:MAG TPA: molybdenum cofactor biosynthesis protein MoaE [Acidimicrobiales bacterium]|nr:molybdenum cofactor biosynthesis protein MoaE [Acidimicrobiales bacterium]